MDGDTREFMLWLLTQIDGANASAESWMASGDLQEAGYHSGRGAAFLHALDWWRLRQGNDETLAEFMERMKGSKK